MQLRSKLGTGTVVRITLPREPQQAEAVRRRRELIPASARLRARPAPAPRSAASSDRAAGSPSRCCSRRSGSTIGMLRTVSAKPQRLRKFCRHHARPAPGLHMGIEDQKRVRRQRRRGLGADRRQRAVDDAAVLHVRASSRHSGTWPTSFQVTCLRSPNMASGDVSRR